MAWDIQNLKDDVEHLYGKAQMELLSESLESIIDRKDYASYHFKESAKLLREVLADKSDGISLVKLILGFDEQDSHDFFLSKNKAKANIIACLQSMHAVADILSHAIYYSLNMNNNPSDKMEPRLVDIHTVLAKMSKHEEYKALCKYVKCLIGHANYKYMGVIVNRSKHRSIVGMPYKLDIQKSFDDWSHGIEFHAFEHDCKLYTERWVDDYLKTEFARQDQLLLEIGNELNRVVRDKKASVRMGG